MSAPPAQRKLAAILMSDIVGYSSRMSKDEAGTLALVQTWRETIVEPLLETHGGRLVKFMGDGFLAEFHSTVAAAECGIALLRALRAMPEPRLSVRTGIALGDVVETGGDLYGDGVNLAARLQEIAEPDSLCIAANAYGLIEGRVDAAFERIGGQRLKGFERPVDTWIARTDKAPDRPGYLGKLPWVDLPAGKPALITGGCLCGRTRYEVSQPDLGAMFCHCSMCRRSTGAVGVAGITVEREATRWIGEEPAYYRSSKIAERGFCPVCGTSLTYRSVVGEWTRWYLLMIGSLDEPGRFQPVFHLGVESRIAWFDLPDGMPRMSCRDSPSLKEAYAAVGEEVP